MTGSLWQVASQVLTLFLLMGVGFAMTKRRLLNEEGRRQMTTLVMDIVTPCVIINAFTSNFESGLPGKLLIGFAAAILAHVIGIAVSVLLFHRQTPEDRGVLRFSVIYSNCGYMGLPLINAVLGSGALIYGAAYIAVFNAFLWTHGLLSMSKGKGQRLSLVKVFVNPGTIGIAAALP
ncbi:MAG: AEC family transporter, partial [Oscillospiraceae bacterium]|nr:AEC family transporter [Oscillospiraceae bacterium]